MIYILCCVLFIFLNIEGGTGECSEDETCQSSLLYDDLKCKPIFAKEGDCCPNQYDCSHIENRPDGHCHLNGRFYKPMDSVDDDLIYRNCHVACRCAERSEYTCAVLDCPEWLGNIRKPACYLKYELNKCCSIDQVCPPFDDIATCTVGDKVYKEGQRFRAPDQKCVKCVCGKDFDGKYEEPFCTKETCTAEIIHSKAIRDNCAPAYRDLNDCCPWDWICPAETDDEIQSAETSNSESDLQCKFGDKLFKLGDKFQRITEKTENSKTEINCECKIPPFLTCTVTYHYKPAPPLDIRPLN